MRLLNTETLQLSLFHEEPFPKYAILSHRWGQEEVYFQELETGLGANKSGYQKIKAFCIKARERGFSWCWVDTCGIDKTSSAELSEAINSMYKWYGNSAVCFAYLPDVQKEIRSDGSSQVSGFDNSCWFSRGWTLQELIAPRSVEFYTSDWVYIGDKRSMAKQLSSITTIDEGVLLGTTPVEACSVANIMSWASRRVTTRKEDTAYCLLGLFGLHMPLLYGEGARAFIRLQEEILKQSSDQSLFAWNPASAGVEHGSTSVDRLLCGILAPSPSCFSGSRDVIPVLGYWDTESALTNRGIRLRMPLKYDTVIGSFIGILSCTCRSARQGIAIEFHSNSNSIEDPEHLIRRPVPMIFGSWSDDPQVQLSTVYLATDSALLHINYFGQRFLKTEYEFNVLLKDLDLGEFIDSKEHLVCHPPGATVANPSVDFKKIGHSKCLAVLNPVKSIDNTVSLALPTKLSQNIALRVGIDTLQSGLLDVQHPWKIINPMSKGCLLEEMALQTVEERRDVSEVTIDEVRVRVNIVQQTWWARTCWNILISFSRADGPMAADIWMCHGDVNPDNVVGGPTAHHPVT
jgi:hypothetical protein